MTETNLTGTTPDITAQNIEALKSLFPEVCSDGKIDFEKLQQLLGKEVDTSPERYNFSWNGKSQALHLSQSPSTGTLIPCKEESSNFDSTQNLYIEGDNLEVLKLLQKPYHKAVKMIYIDPPYNTGSDFVYPDDFKDSLENYLELTGQVDSDGRKMGTNAESNGRYHTDWLNMMYARLRLAHNLLRDDGAIFISIDDNEIGNLRKICDEVFGEENFISQIIVKNNPRGRQSDSFIATVHEYLLCYAKILSSCCLGGKLLTEEQRAEYTFIDKDQGPYRLLGLRQRGVASLREDRPDMFFPIYVNPNNLDVSLEKIDEWDCVIPKKSDGREGRWMWGLDKCKNEKDRLVVKKIEKRDEFDIFVKDYLNRQNEERTRKYQSIWDTKELNNQNGTQEVKKLLGGDYMSFPKSLEYIKAIIQLGLVSDSIVLDFFSGSATTAHAVMQLNADDIASGKQGNRKFIMVQLPEPCKADSEAFKAGYKTICEIGKERIRRAGDKIQKELEEKLKNASPDLFNQTTQAEPVLDTGFKVFKLASSNIKKWNPDYEHLDESLWQNVNSFVDGRTELDAVYEIMLKLGLELTCPVEEKELAGKKVYSVARGILIICLDKDITTDLAHAIVELQKTTGVEEMRVVFNDAGFRDDVAKTNCREILKQGGIQEFITI